MLQSLWGRPPGRRGSSRTRSSGRRGPFCKTGRRTGVLPQTNELKEASAMQYRQVAVIGGKGAGPGQFGTSLRGIAVDATGNIYAANDSQITVFDAAGRPWRESPRVGGGTAIGFVGGDVLAGDATGRAIRRFDPTGKFRNNIGRDNPLNGLLIPNGVVDFGVDAHGIIHAANPGKHRVERYTPAGELLGHIGHFHGTDPAGFGGCCNPTNVAVRDRIYVTEKAGPRAKVYSFSGELEEVIAADVFDANCKNMNIAVDRRGRVYVGDTVRLAIFVFEPAVV